MPDTTQVKEIRLPGNRVGVAFASLLALSESIKPPEGVKGLIDGGLWQWVHLAPFGIWRGHPNGEIRFSRANFENIQKVFERRKNPVKVDYEHDSLNDNLPGYEKIAAGYIHNLEIRGDGWGEGDGLYGLVEFTERAASMIKAGEVKYNSPVLAPFSTDRKTDSSVGLELVQAAITSDPFLDGQVPITLTRVHEVETMPDETKTPEQLPLAAADPKPTALAEEVAADATAILRKLGEMTGLDDPAIVAALMDKLEAVAKLLGAEAEQDGTPADEEQPAAASRAAAEPAPAADESETQRWMQAQDGAIKAMSREIASLKEAEAKKADSAIAHQVDDLIKAGNVLPGDRDLAIWAFKKDPEKAALIYRHKRVPAGVTQLTRETPDTGKQTTFELSAVDQKVIDNLVGSGAYTRKEAEDHVINKRSN